MPKGLKYMEEDVLKREFLHALEYRKKEHTDLRKSTSDEIGRQIITYVKKSDGRIVPEVPNRVQAGDIIARNPIPIGKNETNEPIYNEWIIKRAIVVENYKINIESDLTTEFTPHQKQTTLKAIEVTDDIVLYFRNKNAIEVRMNELKNNPEEVLLISVEWTSEPMYARKGDYLTDAGYIITKEDMGRGYEALQSFKERQEEVNNKSDSESHTMNGHI